MKAGLLREILTFKELRKVQSPSGSVKKEYVSVFTCRAFRRKMSAVVDKDGVNAMEQFIGRIIIFQVRNYPIIKEYQRVIYRDQEYEIKLIDPQSDNSLLLTLEKLNT